MNDEQLQKRISQTVFDIYPLDRMLPVETVYSIFLKEYAQSDDKSIFFHDRKFQRLIEGYFALFLAVSLKDMLGKEHYLMFPGDPSNDVYTFYIQDEDKTKSVGYRFDIKEFTSFSDSFISFAEKVIIPKIDIYNIAVGTHRKIEGKDLKFLSNYLKSKSSDAKIWLIGSPIEENNNENISKVTVINKEGFIYDKVIDLNKWLNNTPLDIYQNIIRIK